MATSVEEGLPRLTELPIPILNELLQYTDVRLQAALRRTCVLFNHLLLPRVSSYREIRIFVPPLYPCGGSYFNGFLRRFHAKCLEWFGHSPIRTVIVEGPYDRVCLLQEFCMGLSGKIHFQRLIFIRQTFRDRVFLGELVVSMCQSRIQKKNICQQLTFHDIIFSQLQNIPQPRCVIGRSMGWEERRAYMVREQIIPIRGSLDVHSARFDHDLMDLIERHCPELDEVQMTDIMQWKAACEDRDGLGCTLWAFVAQDDRSCNALYSRDWNELDKESRKLIKAARTVDVHQMTKMARSAFFYSMKQERQEDERQKVKKIRLS